MAHIALTSDAPGIVGLLETFPVSAAPLNSLAQIILRGESSLTAGERELIAAVVSAHNETRFCCASHASAARVLLGERAEVVEIALADPRSPSLDARTRALLQIALRVCGDARGVTASEIAAAREAEVDDRGIHDCVLVAAAFCMYNRYVDGLGTWAPAPASPIYEVIGTRLAAAGYRLAAPAPDEAVTAAEHSRV